MADQKNDQQKFTILPDGSIDIEWVNPSFSDVIIELLPSEERQQIIDLNKKFGTQPKIYCG
jgi:hypothetical protein